MARKGLRQDMQALTNYLPQGINSPLRSFWGGAAEKRGGRRRGEKKEKGGEEKEKRRREVGKIPCASVSVEPL